MAIRSICLVEYVHDVILVLLRAEIHCTICQRNLLKAHLEAQKYCKSVLDLQSAIVTHNKLYCICIQKLCRNNNRICGLIYSCLKACERPPDGSKFKNTSRHDSRIMGPTIGRPGVIKPQYIRNCGQRSCDRVKKYR